MGTTEGDHDNDQTQPKPPEAFEAISSESGGADGDSDEGDLEVFSLDDLGAAYARAAAASGSDDMEGPQPAPTELRHEQQSEHLADQRADQRAMQRPEPPLDPELDTANLPTDNSGMRRAASDGREAANPDDDEMVVTPEAIIEAALFVGHPENKAFSERRLASIIRGVSPDEVVSIIDDLNQSYRDAHQALRIIKDEHGYRMSIAPQVEGVRRSFLGKVREARLSQSAIEVLALVAYQPGVTARKVQDQRGQESGPVLNQLVRRQLLRIERVTPEDGGRAVAQYHTTERFLVLFGLESIDELPQVEEELRDVQ